MNFSLIPDLSWEGNKTNLWPVTCSVSPQLEPRQEASQVSLLALKKKDLSWEQQVLRSSALRSNSILCEEIEEAECEGEHAESCHLGRKVERATKTVGREEE